jgi:hypothetical protein
VLKLGDLVFGAPRLDFPAQRGFVNRHSAEPHRQIEVLLLLRDFNFIRAGRLDEGNFRAFHRGSFPRLERPFLLQPEIGFNGQFTATTAIFFGFGHGLDSVARESALSGWLPLKKCRA